MKRSKHKYLYTTTRRKIYMESTSKQSSPILFFCYSSDVKKKMRQREKKERMKEMCWWREKLLITLWSAYGIENTSKISIFVAILSLMFNVHKVFEGKVDIFCFLPVKKMSEKVRKHLEKYSQALFTAYVTLIWQKNIDRMMKYMH